MKYSNKIGVAAAIALIAICFMPWVYIRSLDVTLNGLHGYVTPDLNFGKQVVPHGLFSSLMIAFFLIQKLWAKRANIFLGALHFAWAVKNYLIFSACRSVECPDIKPGMYLLLVFSFIMMIMALLPKVDMKNIQESKLNHSL